MKWSKKKIYSIISAILLIGMFLFLCHDASRQSFWIDELEWGVAFFNRKSFLGMLKALSVRGYNLPLYYIILFPIYKIAPYGEIWLLLVNFVAIIVGILLLKKIGEKIGGEDLGFMSLCLAVCSYVLVTQGGFELRPYAFLFLFSTLALYCFIQRYEKNTRKNNILYWLSLVLLSYIHWFGCLISIFYFVVDAILFFRKKAKFSIFYPYLGLGLSFLPWAITMFVNNELNILEYWSKVPTFNAFLEVIDYLSSGSKICFFCFFAGAFISLLYIFYQKKKESFYRLVCLGAIVWTIGIIFIYGKWINPNGTLYVMRYFLVILPHVLLVTATLFSELLHCEVKVNNEKVHLEINDLPITRMLPILLIVLCFVVVGIENYRKAHIEINSIYEPYREVAEYISQREDIYDGRSAIMVSDGPTYLIYYQQKRGLPVAPNAYGMGYELYRASIDEDVIKKEECDIEELLSYDTLYIFTVSTTTFSKEVWELVHENYKLVDENSVWQFYTYERKTEEERTLSENQESLA